MPSSWKYIGRIKYGDVEGNIPRWVLSAEKQTSHRYGGASSGLLDK